MDQHNIILLVGVSVAVVVVAYVIWGPNERPRKTKGVAGLVNLGSTCFLNTLLQALASCKNFVEWLDEQSADGKPLTSSLQQVLWILNGKSESETHSPENVLKMLRRNGWVMAAGEQDAHELFHCIISTLQEENKKPTKHGSLSDALPPSDTLSQASDILEDPFDVFETEGGEGSNGEGSKGTSVYEDVSSGGESDNFFSIDTARSDGSSSGTLKLKAEGDVIRRGVLVRAGASPPPAINEVAPFTGLLASSLTCCTCGHSSSTQTATFDSISLTLADVTLPGQLTLPELIRRFVRTEIVPDVHCEQCSANTSAFKTYNFGKLPPCLCFHVGRTAWHSLSRTTSKREEYVRFPEYLVMDPFTWRPGSSQPSQPAPIKAKFLYRLKSVVVHVGGTSSGHFLTYRRGPLSTTKRHEVDQNQKKEYSDSLRWYRTSDENVQAASMSQAMDSLAYMLFYEKCMADLSPCLLGEPAVL